MPHPRAGTARCSVWVNVYQRASNATWINLADKPSSKSSKRRPSPACSPRNAFRNFMLIWLVTLDLRRARARIRARRRRVGHVWQNEEHGRDNGECWPIWSFDTPSIVHCPFPRRLLSPTSLVIYRKIIKRPTGFAVRHPHLLSRWTLTPRTGISQERCPMFVEGIRMQIKTIQSERAMKTLRWKLSMNTGYSEKELN